MCAHVFPCMYVRMCVCVPKKLAYLACVWELCALRACAPAYGLYANELRRSRRACIGKVRYSRAARAGTSIAKAKQSENERGRVRSCMYVRVKVCMYVQNIL